MNAETRTGGCLCRSVTFTAPTQPLSVVVCHCRDCQKQAGSALSVIAVFPRAAIHVTGEVARYEGTSEKGNPVWRNFCPRCGSPLYSDSPAMRERGILAVKAGTLDDVTDLVPTKHYWMRSKQAWVAIPDNVALSEMD